MATLADVLRQTGYAQDGTLAAPATDSPMTKALSEHIKTLPQQLATNQAALDSAINSWNKTDFGTGQPNPNYRPEAIAELTQLMPNIGGITAWHGTPHKIQGAFDISKVGTGEGAQAYGHGMYFAENPSVAGEYKRKLSGGLGSASNELTLNGQPLTDLTDAQRRAYEIVARDGRKNALGTAKDLEEQGFDASHIREALKATKGKEISLVKNEGNLYKVDIPDEHIPNMLDWDKPLAEQTPQVQAAIQKLGDRFRPLDEMEAKNVSGERLYRRIENSLGKFYGNAANPEASKMLNEVGIKGIRYSDAGSRDVAKGQTSNFVVFDPSTVKILEENSKPVSRKALIEEQVNKLKD